MIQNINTQAVRPEIHSVVPDVPGFTTPGITPVVENYLDYTLELEMEVDYSAAVEPVVKKAIGKDGEQDPNLCDGVCEPADVVVTDSKGNVTGIFPQGPAGYNPNLKTQNSSAHYTDTQGKLRPLQIDSGPLYKNGKPNYSGNGHTVTPGVGYGGFRKPGKPTQSVKPKQNFHIQGSAFNSYSGRLNVK